MSDITTTAESLGDRSRRVLTVGAGLGLLGLVVAAILGGMASDGFERGMHAYLVSWFWFFGISMGALFFVIIQSLVRVGWSVVVRRVAEILAANVLVCTLLFLPILATVLLGSASLYPWIDVEFMKSDALLNPKRPFLNAPFFGLRCAIYFLVWIATAWFFLRRSRQQDDSPDAGPTLAMQRRAPIAIILFALSFTYAAFDILMSIDPAWFSTIFGVYIFAGSTLSFFAAMVLILQWLQRRGLLVEHVTVEHYHDLGKFLFAFVFFWSYIAFSQYMLIWYADIPEETTWLARRQEGAWGVISLCLVFGHFAIPFLGLISRHAKRRGRVLAFWACWMLVMHAVDLFWIVIPEAGGSGFPLKAVDVCCFIGVGGLWMAGAAWIAGRGSLIAHNDPRLPESMAFENA